MEIAGRLRGAGCLFAVGNRPRLPLLAFGSGLFQRLQKSQAGDAEGFHRRAGKIRGRAPLGSEHEL
ncbi:hypothetical protein D3C83_214780 [compost metagenome]